MTKSIELQWCIVVVIVSVWRLFSVVMGIVSIPLIFIRFCLIGFFWFWIDGKSRDTERRRGRGRTLWSIIIRKKFLFRNEKINNDHTQKKCVETIKKKWKKGKEERNVDRWWFKFPQRWRHRSRDRHEGILATILTFHPFSRFFFFWLSFLSSLLYAFWLSSPQTTAEILRDSLAIL